MMPQPGMNPQQTQSWANRTMADMRKRGQNPGDYGMGAPSPYQNFSGTQGRQRQATNFSAETQARSRQPASSYSAYSPGQARSQQSPYASATAYNPANTFSATQAGYNEPPRWRDVGFEHDMNSINLGNRGIDPGIYTLNGETRNKWGDLLDSTGTPIASDMMYIPEREAYYKSRNPSPPEKDPFGKEAREARRAERQSFQAKVKADREERAAAPRDSAPPLRPQAGQAQPQQSAYDSSTAYNPSARIRDNRMPQPGEVTQPRQPGPMQYDQQQMLANLSAGWQAYNQQQPTGSRMPGQPAFRPTYQPPSQVFNSPMPNAGQPPFQTMMTGPMGQPADPATYYPQQQAMVGNIFQQMAQAPSGTWLGNAPPPPSFTAPPAFNPMAMWQQAGQQVARNPFAR